MTISLEDRQMEFLAEAYRLTGGDLSAKVSMYDVGEAIGADRDEASMLAQELMGLSLLDVRSLSGGIGITEQGVEAVAPSGPAGGPAADRLGDGPILSGADAGIVNRVMDRVKKDAGGLGLAFDALNELMADIRTVDVQMASPRPKTAVILACFDAMATSLDETGNRDLAAAIRSTAGK